MADRRRALGLLTAAALGLATGVADEDEMAARKRPRKSKKRSSKKKNKDKKKNGKRGKKQSTSGGAKDVVRVAKKYKGAKYKWGGASPKGFDCSGFTWYVYNKAVGMDIGRTVLGQWELGRSVSRGSLSPGDIVFFENTFERGLSHCGISLGGSTFIHAENENTGVVISDLSSGYYDDHYAGARRLV
jgi:cell wall-associated NlpC family hydrolase